MTYDIVINIAQEALKTTLLLAAPLLISSLVVGVAIAIFQAVTQINEVTLTFVPKIIIVVVAILVAAPWMLQLISEFTISLYEQIPFYIR
jgi:flagellar biosynthesis protein FliQ